MWWSAYQSCLQHSSCNTYLCVLMAKCHDQWRPGALAMQGGMCLFDRQSLTSAVCVQHVTANHSDVSWPRQTVGLCC